MPAMVFPMMKYLTKFVVKSLLWMARIIEKQLETFDDKAGPNVEPPIAENEVNGNVPEVNEPGGD